MKKRKIIGGVLAVLMLCGILVGCSSNSAQTAPYEKGTITETEFTSKWMGLKYTLPNGMVMMTEEYLESLAASIGKGTGRNKIQLRQPDRHI